VKWKLQKIAYFIAVKSLDVLPEHKIVHPARCRDIPKRLALITFSYFSPSQAKVLNGGGPSCLLAIPAIGRIVGLCKRKLNSDRGICLQ
jgi:hypothetical protein